MFALTADQRSSRRDADRVPQALTALSQVVATPALPFERTVGDEIQGLLSDPLDALLACRALARMGGWHIGLGVGAVDLPLPGSTREARGDAFLAARDAVDEAKRMRPSINVRTSGRTASEPETETDVLIRLLALLWERRTPAGWQAVTAVESARGTGVDASLDSVADALEITQPALTQRLAAAAWHLERDALPVAARMLEHLDGTGVPA